VVLAFGCLWATLIFCIDRSLVITLKKDPTKAKQKFIVPLLSRAALAIVVAFMVSIPLELVIFEDYIAANEENFNANQIAY
jgi:Mn2+/Fe2+ NRAMP family transporter